MGLSININDKDGTISLPNKKRRVVKSDNKTKLSLLGRTQGTSTQTNEPLPPISRKKKLLTKKKAGAILVIVVLLCSVGAYLFKDFASSIGLKISASDIIDRVSNEPELQKDGSGMYTNIMLVGIDTRETNQGLQNTDTIIVASYNHATSETVMFSVPRDTYASIPNQDWYVKINGLYNSAEQNEEGSGLTSLKGTVEDYVGLKIQYYAMIDVKGLANIIDLLGGVDVYVENSFTDYAYPDENSLYSVYQTVSFEQGPQTMDGDTAIKYARSRKSLDNGEGSDFSRARRQQNLIVAIKDKALSSETLLNPKRLLEIMSQLQENIRVSEFTTEDIEAGLKILKDHGESESYTFVLDPNIAQGKILTENLIPESYAVAPRLGLGEYQDLHSYIKTVLSDPDLYVQDPTIYTYDIGLGYEEANAMTESLQEKYPYLSITYAGTLYTDKSGSYVYDNSLDDEYSSFVELFSSRIDLSIAKPDFVLNRLNGEDIIIMLGKEVIEEPVEQVTTN